MDIALNLVSRSLLIFQSTTPPIIIKVGNIKMAVDNIG